MITVNIHMRGRRLQEAPPLDRIDEVVRQEESLLWIDVAEPTVEDLDLLRREFEFHPLALEDVVREHQRPKVDIFDGYLLIVVYDLQPTEGSVSVRPAQLGLFVGPNYVVTVHTASFGVLAETKQRWTANVAQVGLHGVGMLAYSILDAIVDGYFPVIDAFSDRIDALEEMLFSRFDPRAQEQIFEMKKDLLAIRRVVAPERDVLNVLIRRDTPIFDDDTGVYLQDVYDHLIRVVDAIDVYRDLLSSALDAYLSLTSNRLNRVMQTLTASSIILMSMTLVASVYGMNFVHMPELSLRLGYPWALGLMAAVGAGVFAVFRRAGWI